MLFCPPRCLTKPPLTILFSCVGGQVAGRGVLFDLAWSLLAALFVGLLPGWFWSGYFFPSNDLAVRLAYAVAFSLTLVPAVALVPARLFGLGVTPTVAVFCALLVLGAGFAVHRRFGPADKSRPGDEPLGEAPGPLGVLPLVLLLPAFGLALLVASGISYDFLVYMGVIFETSYGFWVWPTAALLLLFAAVVYALEARRNANRFASGSEPETSPAPFAETGAGRAATGRIAPQAALMVVLALVLLRAYVGPVLLEWPFVRGVDQYSHAVMANLMRAQGSVESYLVYPPGFHTMSAMVAGLTGLDPLEVFPVLAPALLALPPLALYALASRLWGPWCGVAAALFSGLLTGGSYHYFEDGMYPNMVASQFLLVLALCALFGLYRAPSVGAGLAVALLGGAVVLYHPVASMYEALLLALAGMCFVPYLLLRERRTGIAVLLSLALLFVLAVLYAWDTYDLPRTVAGFVSGSSETGRGGEAAAMAVGTQQPFGLQSLLVTVSLPVLFFGLLGAFVLLFAPWRRGGAPYALARITLLAWCLMLFVGSRTPLSAFPQRFERDLGIPLALLAAFAVVALLRSATASGRAAKVLAILVAYLAAVLVLPQAVVSFEDAAAPSWRMVMTPPIAEAGEWLEEHNEGGNILVSPHLWNQVPSRMMLAMGDYTALQSFDEGQLRVPRDLPPTGAQPPRDILWVLDNPGDERTQKILEKYDVRYIVLYKNFPGRPPVDYWKDFQAHGDLYSIAFQNRDVVILEPKL